MEMHHALGRVTQWGWPQPSGRMFRNRANGVLSKGISFSATQIAMMRPLLALAFLFQRRGLASVWSRFEGYNLTQRQIQAFIRRDVLRGSLRQLIEFPASTPQSRRRGGFK